MVNIYVEYRVFDFGFQVQFHMKLLVLERQTKRWQAKKALMTDAKTGWKKLSKWISSPYAARFAAHKLKWNERKQNRSREFSNQAWTFKRYVCVLVVRVRIMNYSRIIVRVSLVGEKFSNQKPMWYQKIGMLNLLDRLIWHLKRECERIRRKYAVDVLKTFVVETTTRQLIFLSLIQSQNELNEYSNQNQGWFFDMK